MLKLENVNKSYKKNVILKDISISFKSGLYIIQGVNGSGKSTLLKIISGIIYKNSGKIHKDIRISYLPDKFSLPKLMRVNSYLYNFINDNDKKKICNEIMNKFQIPNKLLGNLSKGNIQKVGIAQVLLYQADCYIFDEPLDGLDSDMKKIFKLEIEKLICNKKIVIISLHNKSLFNNLSPILINIRDGECDEKRKRASNQNIN